MGRFVKRQSSNEYIDLVKGIKEAIDRHDPMGLRAVGAPSDEYEPQASSIARAVLRCGNLEEFLDATWNAFYDSFGESAGRREDYDRLATDVYDLARTRDQTSSRRSP